MIDTDSLTIALPREAVRALTSMAERTERDVAELIAEAVTNYLDHQQWMAAAIQDSVAEIDAGAELIPPADIEAWVPSWGTPTELPPPGR